MNCMIARKNDNAHFQKADKLNMIKDRCMYLMSNQNTRKNLSLYSIDITLFSHRSMTMLRSYSDKGTRFKILEKWLVNACCRIEDCNMHAKHTNHFSPKSNIQHGPQLNLWNGFVIGITRSTGLKLSSQKACNSQKICIVHRMSTSSNATAPTRKLFENKNDSIDTLSNGQKKQVGAMVVSSQKKAKGKGNTFQRPSFWLGFHTLNAIACENDEPEEPTLSVSELVKLGMDHEEALEHLEAVPSFPFVLQQAWPSKRPDGKEGGHFNLTQVPFDVETDDEGFALDYQIAIAFELCDRNLSKDEIYAKTEARLKAMDIHLGEIL